MLLKIKQMLSVITAKKREGGGGIKRVMTYNRMMLTLSKNNPLEYYVIVKN